MQITFWGTRGSIASPGPNTVRYGGNTSCVEVRLDNGTLLVLDAGTGLRALVERLGKHAPIRVYLFLSHLHWDHIQGLPFFAPAYVKGTEIYIVGPPGGQVSLEQRLYDQMRCPYFPIPMPAMAATMHFVELAEGHVFALPDATIEAHALNHPGQSLGYRLTAEDKVVVYASDHEPFGKASTSHHLTQPPHISPLMQKADLLIHDAQYTPSDYPQHVGWGHSTYLDALHTAQQTQAKRLALFHHDPSRSDRDIDRIVARCQAWIKRRGCALTCFSAAEGTQLCL
jgi:phosphoribosyl 1,2-cyclic phosphodiesterase